MKTLFIYDPKDLDSPIPGGVQLCSREFLDIVRAASDTVEMLPVSVTSKMTWRIQRKLYLGSYLFYNPDEVRESLIEVISSFSPTHVFINRCELLRLTPLVKELLPNAKVIIMSHGNQTGDDLYEVTGQGGPRSSGLSKLIGIWRLGLDLVTESSFRHAHLDGVCVMSNEEKVLERWIGAKKVVVLPRLIDLKPLEWQPITGRAGFVGTLNHTPNRIALEMLCGQLALHDTSGIEFRLVGGPEEKGQELASKYSFVQYLGRLDDESLNQEVTSWSLFLNPIFWLSRGASMKLGQSLSWGIPVLSTQVGMRGYELTNDQLFVTEDTAAAFAEALRNIISNPDSIVNVRDQLLMQAENWPDTEALAVKVKKAFV